MVCGAEVTLAKVAVAMSGGVDSTVAALLLKEQGHRVLGLSLRLGHGPDRAWQEGARAAAQLGVEHQVVEAGEVFGRLVVEPAVRAYARGLTPNPCAVCNAGVKFPLLWSAARQAGCRFLATGHYVRLEEARGRLLLAEGRDPKKSQAYFLARLEPEILAHLRFPLGGLEKRQVRELALGAGLRAAQRRESQDNCFLPAGGWDEIMAQHRAVRPGVVEDQGGRVLGRHQGLHRFTVGQRRGLGIAAGRRLYVLGLDGRRAAVRVGPAAGLEVAGFYGSSARWYLPPPWGRELVVRHRYSRRQPRAVLEPLAGERVLVKFIQPERAVAPGQLAVFYQGDRVLGSAWIERTIPAREQRSALEESPWPVDGPAVTNGKAVTQSI